MLDEPVKEKPRPKRRVLREEEYNRDGYWTRSFTVRQEVWPIIEHWAAEHGYHLTALKGKKRSYQKTVGASWYRIFIDMKQVENEFTITGTIRVGLGARAMYLFFHPKELLIEPTGWKGSVIRRKTCSELNTLLDRLRQPAIAESLGFHIADLDSSTRVLGALLILPVVYFLLGTVRQLDPNAALTRDVLLSAWKPFAGLTVLGIVLMAIHNFVIVKRWARPLFKNSSVGVAFVLFAVTSVFLFSHASVRMDRSRFLTYCLKPTRTAQCDQLKERLSPEDREWLLNRMNELQKELSVKPKH